MPRLDHIVTRSGDSGTTSLADGSRVSKGAQRVRTYGAIDELNAIFGLVRCEQLPEQILAQILQIQHELFSLGGELATPANGGQAPQQATIGETLIERLERWIEDARNQLQPTETFILPGGTRAAAVLHLARTVTRRCERELVTLMEAEEVNPHGLRYLNRLSDLCFVWARLCNDQGRADIFWNPELT